MLVESLQDQVEYLREQLEREREANRENRRLLAAALERILPQLEAPREAPPEAPESPESLGPTAPTDAGEGQKTVRERPFTGEGAERRGFWSRMFGQ
jgi:hypothetical protein